MCYVWSMIAQVELETSSLKAYDRLTVKQKLFVDKYVLCLNASQAARESGYSVNSAHVIGPENLTKPLVKEAIQDKFKEVRGETALATPDWLRKTTKELVSECKTPKDKVVALDLLGRMTPGTFEPVQQSNTVNIFALIKEVAQEMKSANNVQSGVVTPPLIDIVQSAQALAPQQVIDVVGTPSAPPQPPLVDNNTVPNKILQQNSTVTTQVSGDVSDGEVKE